MKAIIKILCAAGLVMLSGCGGGKKEAREERTTVARVDLRDVITQTGEVQPVVKVELKSEASGRIDKVHVKEGQWVKKGDTIIVIDPSRLLVKKERLDLAAKKAVIERDAAKRDFDNARELVSTGSVSERSLIDSESKYSLAQIVCDQQLLELKDVNDELGKTVVTSPMDGVVTSLDVEKGEIAVSATTGFSGGTAIATIADISNLEVVSQIGEVDYVHMKTGGKVIIRPEAVEGTQTTGTINFIALSAKKKENEELGTFEVRIAIDSLIPGITSGINVNVEFVVMEKKNVLGIPNHFVDKRDNGFSVMRVTRENGAESVKVVPIKVGATDYHHYEIVSGLHEGDVVVLREQKPKGGSARPGMGRGHGPGGRRR